MSICAVTNEQASKVEVSIHQPVGRTVNLFGKIVYVWQAPCLFVLAGSLGKRVLLFCVVF